MRISIISPRYTLTGVAQAQVRFAAALVSRGHDVELVFGCLDPAHLPAGKREAPAIPGAKVLIWNCDRVLGMFAPVCRYLRQRRPDIVFSAEDHLNDVVLLAAKATGSTAMISGSSHVLPVDAEGHDGPYSNRRFTGKWIFKQLTRALMWRADAMTCVSEDLVEEYRKLFGRCPHVCVTNVVIDTESRRKATEPVDHPWFAGGGVPVVIGAGTLTQRKGFVDLIRAVRHLADRGRDVRLVILGEGPMRQELAALVQDLGIQDRVWLAGRVENPFKYYAKAHVFVLSSYAEGLGMVLVEAMMAGCVPVATTCRTGPREILRDGRYGYLVPVHDPAAMATGIENALDSPISAASLAEAVAPYEADAVVDRHFEVLGLPQHEPAGQ